MRALVTILGLFALVTPALASDSPPLITSWGGPGGGPGQFNHPRDLAIAPNGNLYVVDRDNNRVQYFTSSGTYLGQWGSYGYLPAQFNSPNGIAIDKDGDVYVSDRQDRVQKFTATGDYLMTFSNPAYMFRPVGVAVDAQENLYVGSTYILPYVSKYDASGQFLTVFTSHVSVAYSMELDGRGDLFVSNSAGPYLQRFTTEGIFVAGYAPSAIPEVGGRGLAVDPAGNVLFVWTDLSFPDEIVVLSNDLGKQLDHWNPPTPPGGTVPAIEDLAVGPEGVAYLADFANNAILKVQYSVPVPVLPTTWGRLKAAYR